MGGQPKYCLASNAVIAEVEHLFYSFLDIKQAVILIPRRVVRNRFDKSGADILADDVFCNLEIIADIFRQLGAVNKAVIRKKQENAFLEFHQIVCGDIDKLCFRRGRFCPCVGGFAHFLE